ncbi:MAG TPA: L,D-transpeptidase family protein [Solirubrobacteraceae bacterium]|jgi:peptidoglycan hydrolase-like protein with peptidoglycan-binding domain
MNVTRRLSVALFACCSLAVLPSVAAAEEAPPVISPAPTPVPALGALKLSIQRVGGKPLFARVGAKVVFRGAVTPYVAGQTVQVTFLRGGRALGTETVPVTPLGTGARGQIKASFSSSEAGPVKARAAHLSTPQQAAFGATSKTVQIVHENVAPGSHGQSVRLLQRELAAMHYATPVSGNFDEATGRALVAYRKMTGLERIPAAGHRVFELLARGAGHFHVRYRHDGRHVEANLTKQVLAEIEPGGKIHAIYTTSSGKPSTPTVIGRFTVYSKTPGTNSEGMVDSNYFIRGYAIHGYAEVPTYAASHGCLRVPIPDAPAIYVWVQYGTPVDVYFEDGGGSARVRGDAGP